MQPIEQNLNIIQSPATKIVRLYLEKLELLSEEERKVLIKAIHFISTVMFVYDK